MKKLLTLILSMALFVTVYSQTNVSGTISANTTWNLAGSPYIVTGNLTIAATYILTINAGVNVKFDNGRSMFVSGTVNATSTTFTSNDGSPIPGIWNLFEFYSGASGTLTGCTIEYGDYIDVNPGATVTINSSTIENMYYYGVYNGGTLNVSNSTIDLAGYVSYGYGLYTFSSSITNLNNVNIFNSNCGVYIYSDASQVNFTDCTLSSNEWPVYFRYAGDITIAGTNSFTGNTRDAFYIFPGSISKNWTLPYTDVDVPYYFRTNFTVNNTYTLTIAANNIIKFPLYTGMEVKGKLIANAGAGTNIFFTSERDDNWGGDTNGDGTSTAPAVSNWYGVRFFDESDDASVMRRCQLRYAGYGSLGGITLYDASPVIDLCELQFNYYGAYFQNASNPTFTNNTIGSSSITPIAMSFEANPTFTNNVLSFMDNQYDAIGLIGGTLTANAHLIQRDFTTVNNITYYMLSEIIVPSGLTLTIDAGIVIKSSTYYNRRFRIQGKLVANANPANRIIFTSAKDDNHGNPGDTNKDGTITTPSTNDISGIIFEDGYDPTSIVDNVTIKYAGIWNYYYSNGGSNHTVHGCAIATLSAVAPVPAGPTISNCEIRESAYGVSSYQASNPIVSNNSFINISNTPLSLSGSSDPTYSGNTFTNCGYNALGLIGHNVVVSGTISKRTVAGYTNITYVLLEDITVKDGTELDIDPGVVVKMLSKYWYIYGGFKMNGTLAEHVIFTSLYDDNVGNPMDTNGDGNASTPSAGNWRRIEFQETSDDAYCKLNYADLQYGGYSSYGTIRTINASPTVNNTLIDQSSGFGIRCDGNSAPTFDGVAIQNCTSDPIAMSLTSNPTFLNITFSANYSNGIYILEGTLSSNATLIKRNVAGFTNIAYIIDALTISAGTELILEEGLVIKFRGSYFDGIYVHGGLSAIGTAGQKIIFTSFKDDSAGGDTNNDGSITVPGGSDWDGILYYPEADDAVNKLIYCELRYGGGGYSNPFGASSSGAVRIKDSYVQINECIFQQGTHAAIGIYGSANPAITNCEIYNFNTYPVFMSMFANPTFSGNTVANIKYTAIGIQNETWSQTATIPQRNFAGYTNITYMFNNATINSGTTITIPAGTVIKSFDNTISVNGELIVNGTAGNPVVFTDYRDDSYGNPADTEQNGSASSPTTYGTRFNFNDVSDDGSIISNALLRYEQYPVALYSASPTISNCSFYKNVTGISNSGVCTPAIMGNSFNDLSYAPMSISLVSYPMITVANTISGTTYKGIAVNSETLTQDVTLPKRSFAGIVNAPYIFSNYTIGTGVTLTIDPGVVCKFNSYTSMTVNNGLIAEGLATSGGNIVFTSITDDFYGGDTNADGDATASSYIRWYGITINDVALDPLTRFENCIFRNTRSNYGAIRTISSSPSVLNCSFNNNYRGIYATAASNPTVNFCDFYNIFYEAINNVDQSFVIDAENCWWGDNSGPTHAGNPGGTGETVTDAVDYDPYGTSGAINPLTGDVSLNSLIQAYDASLILLWLVNPGLYPLSPTQLQVADVSGAAGVTAMDASYILQYVVGLINYFPAEILAPQVLYTSDVELTIGNLNVEQGEIFEIPVEISNVDGIFGMQMDFNYDTQYLTALEVTNLAFGMNSSYFIDEDAGTINIAFAGIEALNSDMTIVNLKFKANEDIGLGTETQLEGTYFMANETDLTGNIHNGTIMINGIATGINNETNSVQTLNCYPNPFNKLLNINYTVVNDNENVTIEVFDLFGKLVAVIVDGNHKAETYSLQWNGLDKFGNPLQNGLYFIRMNSHDKVKILKIQIVR